MYALHDRRAAVSGGFGKDSSHEELHLPVKHVIHAHR